MDQFNAGRIVGVLKIIEIHLERPAQWFVCLLHTNGLPFRHVFETIDGKTSGPTTFHGTIGSKLEQDVATLHIVNFANIEGNIQNLSNDIEKS